MHIYLYRCIFIIDISTKNYARHKIHHFLIFVTCNKGYSYNYIPLKINIYINWLPKTSILFQKKTTTIPTSSMGFPIFLTLQNYFMSLLVHIYIPDNCSKYTCSISVIIVVCVLALPNVEPRSTF